jgi:hypothetical protein
MSYLEDARHVHVYNDLLQKRELLILRDLAAFLLLS